MNKKTILEQSLEIISHYTSGVPIVICGPTATGKSCLAIDIALQIRGEIISADSRLVYKDMDIGTAKPSPEELRKVRHYLIDIISPDVRYDLAQYLEDAKGALGTIIKRGYRPVIVGGTGLYISALIDDYQLPVNSFSLEKREELESLSLFDLQDRLKEHDLEKIKHIDEKNKIRLIRAIEILESQETTNTIKSTNNSDVCMIGLTAAREILYQRINDRVDIMIRQGLLDEVKHLGEKYGWDSSSMSGIGYKQLGMYCREEISFEEAVDLLKRDSRRYAKRQITWFKRDSRIHWLDIG